MLCHHSLPLGTQDDPASREINTDSMYDGIEHI